MHPTVRQSRIAPDVSVLLAGLLDLGSYSNQCLASLDQGTVVLGRHVEDMALRVLRTNAPNLVGDFADGLLQLAQHTTVERVADGDRSCLPPWAARLSGEDQQVLADSLAGKVNFLLTHDWEFFRKEVPGIKVKSPSSFLWNPNDPRLLDGGNPFAWTFLGQFWPNWSSEAIRDSGEIPYVMDLTGKAELFYEPAQAAFVFRWFQESVPVGMLTLPQAVEWQSSNFVAVAVDADGIFIFINGETRGRNVAVGPVPPGARIYPFNNSRGAGQINGYCQFRMAPGRLTERIIRRLWRTRSLELSDGELRFIDLVSTTRSMLGPI